MDSDESVHSESEFYYPEEEIRNETTALKYEEFEQDLLSYTRPREKSKQIEKNK